ncbi:DUF4233 domain-containing protein [Corynebacterium canis]|uniref:DUF4233 domain-containing protein n=1 Tax=Corynebacterium canis TaxID=679663 RepID=A0A5C5UII9_9CORY|nr:DUF4233 domain-containing protein [Corynebacterium canis]TWT26541.1 DUF4233 domain-containing protein [Corynebacterium canis]WJY75985.1 hypothetical protein CCANI_10805 [Corynebacterium canis]
MSESNEQVEYGPLGPGHAPEKDPLKGLRGVIAGTLVMEAIAILLVLTVIARVDNGAYWTTFNWVYVTAVGVAMLLAAFVQSRPWAMSVNLVLQAFALIGFIVHPSMGIMALIFIAVWWYILHLRRNLIARMKRGLLTTQHT